jgi:type IV pilus assembly protein PilO
MKGRKPMDFFKDRVITKVDWLIIGISLFLLVMLTLGYFFAASYVGNQIDERNKEIQQLAAEKADLEKKKAEIDKVEKEIEEMREAVASFEGRLPTDKEVPRLLSQFQKIAEMSGIKYHLVKAEPIVEKDLYIQLPYSLKVRGTYPELGEFLRSLEFGDRFIRVDDIKIDEEDEGDSEANFVISTFMFITEDETSTSGVKQS